MVENKKTTVTKENLSDYFFTKAESKAGIARDRKDKSLIHLRPSTNPTAATLYAKNHGIVFPRFRHDLDEIEAKVKELLKSEAPKPKPKPAPEPKEKKEPTRRDLIRKCMRTRAVRECWQCLRYGSTKPTSVCPYRVGDKDPDILNDQRQDQPDAEE